MKKIYCKNCKCYEPNNLWGYEECWAKAEIYIKQGKHGKIYQQFVGKLEKDIEFNKNNNCPFYKRETKTETFISKLWSLYRYIKIKYWISFKWYLDYIFKKKCYLKR